MEARFLKKTNRIHIEFSTLLFDDDFDFSVTTINKSGANLGLSLTLDGALHLASLLKDTTSELIKTLDKES